MRSHEIFNAFRKQEEVKGICLLVAICVFAVNVVYGADEPDVSVTGLDKINNTTYDVSGKLSKVARFDGGPGGYAAKVTATGNSTHSYTPKRELCLDHNGSPTGEQMLRVKSSNIILTVRVTVEMKMPNWKDKDDRDGNNNYIHPEAARQEWDRFYSALKTHENGHVDRAKEWYTKEKIAPYLGNIDITTECFKGPPPKDIQDGLKKQVDDAVKQGMKSFEKDAQSEHDKYDKNTKHGETEGATLDGSKEP